MSFLKELNIVWACSILPGWGFSLLIPMDTYTTYNFPGGQDSLSTTPGLNYGFVAVPWL